MKARQNSDAEGSERSLLQCLPTAGLASTTTVILSAILNAFQCKDTVTTLAVSFTQTVVETQEPVKLTYLRIFRRLSLVNNFNTKYF